MMYFTKQELADIWDAISLVLEEDLLDAPEAKRIEKLARKFKRNMPKPNVWPAPKLEWEMNGPNSYAEIAEVEIMVGPNDRTGHWYVFVDRKQQDHAYATESAAKNAAQRVANTIMKEVQ